MSSGLPKITFINTGNLTIRRDETLSPAGLSYFSLPPSAITQIPVLITIIDYPGRTLYIDSGLDSRRFPMGHSDETRYCPQRIKQRRRELPQDKPAFVFYTHLHSDHCGNLHRIRPEKCCVHELECNTAFRSMSRRDGYLKRLVKDSPFTLLRDKDFRGEGLPFLSAPIPDFPGLKALLTPGHTPGGLSYYLEYGKHRLLFAGDLCESWAGLYYPPPSGSWDYGMYIEQVALVRAWLDYDKNLLVVPSHETAIPQGKTGYKEIGELILRQNDFLCCLNV